MMNTAILKSGDLTARVLAPENSRYNRTRFNHSAFLPDVWYKGTKFTQYERNQNDGFITTEGSGICCEYDNVQIMRDTPVGEWYLKPGIGVLKREKDEWGICQFVKYQPFDTKYDIGADNAVFETESPNVNGYAYKETRAVKLNGDEITLAVTLKNVGEKAFQLEEYCHNFLSLGDRDVGPGYRLDVPGFVNPASMNGSPLSYALVGDEKGFTFSGEVLKSFYVKSYETQKAPVTWRMSHSECGAFIQEADSFTPNHIAVWGDYYVFSCEVFLPIDLKPGEEMNWTRKWKFGV